LILALAGVSVSARAEAAPPTLDRSKYMTIDQIKVGMKGFGRSVFRGAKIEEFQVEVLGVIRNSSPKMNTFWVRCSGADLDHLGVSQGMSGSPIYFEDPETKQTKMAGALAFAFPFAKEPLAGIQPIDQMIGIPGTDGKTEPPFPAGVIVSWADSEADDGHPLTPWQRVGLAVDRQLPTFDQPTYDGQVARPLAVPLACGSPSDTTLAWLQESLRGANVVPVTGGAVSGTGRPSGSVKFEPGSVLAVPLLMGDWDLAAIGTVTEVIDNVIIGFGHPFLGLGRLDAPIATGEVHTVVARRNISFKLGGHLEVNGSLLTDESTAVVGWSDRQPKTIPLSVRIDLPNERGRNYSYKVADNRVYAPIFIGAAVSNSATAFHALPEHSTVRYGVKARFEGLGELEFDNVTSGLSGFFASFMISSMIAQPVATLMENPLGRNILSNVEAFVEISPGRTDAFIEKAFADRLVYKPGETVKISVRLRPFRKPPVIEELKFSLPKDLPDGQYSIRIGDSNAYLMDIRMREPSLFDVKNQEQILKALMLVGKVRDNRIYAMLSFGREGLSIRGQKMPELPGSRRMIYSKSGAEDSYSTRPAIVAAYDSSYVLRGGGGIKINVNKRAWQ
jgi:hypothetical protein